MDQSLNTVCLGWTHSWATDGTSIPLNSSWANIRNNRRSPLANTGSTSRHSRQAHNSKSMYSHYSKVGGKMYKKMARSMDNNRCSTNSMTSQLKCRSWQDNKMGSIWYSSSRDNILNNNSNKCIIKTLARIGSRSKTRSGGRIGGSSDLIEFISYLYLSY